MLKDDFFSCQNMMKDEWNNIYRYVGERKSQLVILGLLLVDKHMNSHQDVPATAPFIKDCRNPKCDDI